MVDKNCPHVEQAAAHVLGVLHGAELAHYQAHLEECPVCQLEVQALQGVRDLLGYATPPLTPPARLRDRILAQAAATPQEPSAQQLPAPVSRPAAARASLPAWAAAAMVTMAVGLAGLGWQVSRLSGEVARMHQEAAPTWDRLPDGSGARQINIPAMVVPLVGTEAAPDARGQVMLLPAQQGIQVVVRAVGLRPLDGPQVYHLWLLQNGQRTDGGTFEADPLGWAAHTRWFPEVQQWEAVGITLEPDAGSTSPRGTKVLGGNIGSG